MSQSGIQSRFIGGILLIVGVSIGGGMLALPVANAAIGMWPSSFFLLLCWAFMTISALFILEANSYLPPGKHMVSMAAETMGKPGILIAWLSYLFLLYTLLCGYISGGADVFGSIFAKFGIHLSAWVNSIVFTLVFGTVVYGGVHRVDVLNRGIMFGKLVAFFMLVFLISPHIDAANFHGGNVRLITGSIMILITAFGFAIIVPNLREYFNDDMVLLRKVIIIGSLIPLLCYLAWDAVIMGTLPRQGETGLTQLMTSDHATSDLARLLSNTIQSNFITSLFDFFTSICMLSAFLGVALCLISFLADGLKMEQKGREGLGLFLLTFVPPLLIVIYYPGAYIRALNYAGFFCIILLLLLPALMVLFGRRKFTSKLSVPGGWITPGLVILFSIVLMLNAFWQFLK